MSAVHSTVGITSRDTDLVFQASEVVDFFLNQWVLRIALFVFEPKKRLELGKGLGEGIRGFMSAMERARGSLQKTTSR